MCCPRPLPKAGCQRGRFLALNEEMVMLRNICIKIRLGSIDRHLASSPRVRELMQRVVDRGQRDRYFCRERLFVKNLSGDVALSPLPNSIQPNAIRCRVGRKPTSRNMALTSRPKDTRSGQIADRGRRPRSQPCRCKGLCAVAWNA